MKYFLVQSNSYEIFPNLDIIGHHTKWHFPASLVHQPSPPLPHHLDPGPLALGHGGDAAGLLHGPAGPHLEVLDPVLDARPPELLVAPLAVPVGALLGKGW